MFLRSQQYKEDKTEIKTTRIHTYLRDSVDVIYIYKHKEIFYFLDKTVTNHTIQKCIQHILN